MIKGMNKNRRQYFGSNVSGGVSAMGMCLRKVGWCSAALLITFNAQAETFYFHNDHLGTPQTVTDNSQRVVWKGEYDPFGKVTETVALVEQNIRFPGQYFDQETGLHYNYFRTYDPSTGRYAESGPIGLTAGLSTYGYVGGNPNRFVDPYGLDRLNAGVGFSLPVLGGFAIELFVTDGEGEGCLPDIGISSTGSDPIKAPILEGGAGKLKAATQLSFEPNGGRGEAMSADAEISAGVGAVGLTVTGVDSGNLGFGIEGGLSVGVSASIIGQISLSVGDIARAAAVWTGDFDQGIFGATESSQRCECQ